MCAVVEEGLPGTELQGSDPKTKTPRSCDDSGFSSETCLLLLRQSWRSFHKHSSHQWLCIAVHTGAKRIQTRLIADATQATFHCHAPSGRARASTSRMRLAGGGEVGLGNHGSAFGFLCLLPVGDHQWVNFDFKPKTTLSSSPCRACALSAARLRVLFDLKSKPQNE